MRSILRELWNGNISPMDQQYPRRSHYDEAIRVMCENEDKLKSMLDDQEKTAFKMYQENKDKVDEYNEEDAFIAGFRLAVRLVVEAFGDDGGSFTDDV